MLQSASLSLLHLLVGTWATTSGLGGPRNVSCRLLSSSPWQQSLMNYTSACLLAISQLCGEFGGIREAMQALRMLARGDRETCLGIRGGGLQEEVTQKRWLSSGAGLKCRFSGHTSDLLGAGLACVFCTQHSNMKLASCLGLRRDNPSSLFQVDPRVSAAMPLAVGCPPCHCHCLCWLPSGFFQDYPLLP